MPDILERISYGGVGFIIKIDNDSYTVGGNSRIDLMSGVETNVAVERIISSQLSYPYSMLIFVETITFRALEI